MVSLGQSVLVFPWHHAFDMLRFTLAAVMHLLAHLSGNRQTFSCPQHHVWSRQDLVLFSKGHHFGTVATVLTVVNTLLPRTLTSPMRFQCECHVRHGLVVQSLIICGPFGSWRGFSKNTMLHRSDCHDLSSTAVSGVSLRHVWETASQNCSSAIYPRFAE